MVLAARNVTSPRPSAHWLALGAIVLWASVAALGVVLSHVPPFLLTGVSLLVGSTVSLPLCVREGRLDLRALRVPRASLLGAAIVGTRPQSNS